MDLARLIIIFIIVAIICVVIRVLCIITCRNITSEPEPRIQRRVIRRIRIDPVTNTATNVCIEPETNAAINVRKFDLKNEISGSKR